MKQKISIFLLIVLWILVLDSCDSSQSKGAILFKRNCANCHGQNAEGFKNLYPGINENSRINTNLEFLPCIIKNGISEHHPLNSKEYNLPMLANDHLSDIDITNIRNYVVNHLLKKSDYKSLDETKHILESCN